ncbi:hypothetical protein [Jannaschia sp. R86511]|uniref:hypothetical protein n=1 Tax=Jannaschia sp. R86511 TaxID=3093853 RepID=UPI0036D243B2
MSRGVLALDRVVVLLLGVLVVLGSAFLAVWGLGRWPGSPAEVSLTWFNGVPEHPWWPWALGVGGVLAVLVGLRAVLAHARRGRVRTAGLRGADDVPGRARADLAAVVEAAAEQLSRTPWVDSARGHVVLDRGTTVLELVAHVDAAADLATVRAAVDRTRDQLAVVLPAGTVHLRVRLDVRRSRVENSRVA